MAFKSEHSARLLCSSPETSAVPGTKFWAAGNSLPSNYAADEIYRCEFPVFDFVIPLPGDRNWTFPDGFRLNLPRLTSLPTVLTLHYPCTISVFCALATSHSCCPVSHSLLKWLKPWEVCLQSVYATLVSLVLGLPLSANTGTVYDTNATQLQAEEPVCRHRTPVHWRVTNQFTLIRWTWSREMSLVLHNRNSGSQKPHELNY